MLITANVTLISDLCCKYYLKIKNDQFRKNKPGYIGLFIRNFAEINIIIEEDLSKDWRYQEILLRMISAMVKLCRLCNSPFII